AYDLVSPVTYDVYGRESVKYLPFEANGTGENPSVNDGEFKVNPFEQQDFFYSDNNTGSPIFHQGQEKYFSKTDFDGSPLNRPIKTYAPGDNWVGNNIGVSVEYSINTELDDVKIWRVYDYNV